MMEIQGILDSIESRAAVNLSQNNLTYIDSDGLKHCSKCRAPLQAYIAGKKRTVTCICYEEEQKVIADQERQKMHDAVRERCFNGDRALFSHRFENDDGRNPKLQYVKDYADNFEEFRRNGQGLLLFGNLGAGKTYAAACVANQLIDKGLHPQMITMTEAISGYSSSPDKDEYLRTLCNHSLLIIDELGTERNTEYSLEAEFIIINKVMNRKLPLIVTTNLTLEELTHAQDRTYARIYDRILLVCQRILFDSENHRIAERKERRALFSHAIERLRNQ